MFTVRLGRRSGSTGLHDFTYNDFVRGYTGVLGTGRRTGRFVCKVHPMHKAWITLWPQPDIWKGINLSNHDSVRAFGCAIEFDPTMPKGEARFSF